MPGNQELGSLKPFESITQYRAGYIELACQLTLARKPVAATQNAFKNERFDLVHDIVCRAACLYAGKIVSAMPSEALSITAAK